MYECISVNLLDLALIHNHLELPHVLIHRLHPSRLNQVIRDRHLLPQVDHEPLQILVLHLELSHEQLVVVDLPHEAVSLTLNDLPVLIVLLLE